MKNSYKTYKNLFETIKRRSKKKVYSEKLQKFKGDAEKTRSVMKEILGKCNTKSSTLPTKITVNKIGIFDTKKELMNSINFLQTLKLIWKIKFQMHQSDLIFI